jgi:hypothetical protein
MDDFWIQSGRAKWFEYVRRRFGLVSFWDLAGWIATEPGTVRCNEADREQALVALEDSVKHGEFGPGIVWLPKSPPSDILLGQFYFRLNYGQIVWMGVSADLYASRASCRKWLEARQIRVPPWLYPESPAGEPVAAASVGAPSIPQTVKRSGAPGHPSSMHLVKLEMKRRAETSEMIKTSLRQEADQLVGWLARRHPEEPQLTQKTIQNKLGDQWRSLGGVSRNMSRK